MFKETFITSYLTFYIKGFIGLEGNFVKVTQPNTILKVIPLGATNLTIPINQVSSVDTNFKLDFKSFVWGLLATILGISSLSSNFLSGIIFSLYGILTILSSFQTELTFHSTSGAARVISFIVFEKTKAENCKEIVERLISQRLDDTNVAMHTKENTDRLVDAINNK